MLSSIEPEKLIVGCIWRQSKKNGFKMQPKSCRGCGLI